MAIKDLIFSIVAKDRTGDAFKRVKRSLGEVEGAARSLNERMADTGRRLRNMGAAGSLASAGLAAALKSGLNAADAQAKLARSLDTSAESIAVLQRAAQLSGVSFSEMEQGASRLTRRLSLFAADGSGPAADAIERLGLDAEALLDLPLDERIGRVSRTIRELGDESEQAALFSELFGDRAFTAFVRLRDAELDQAAQDVRDFNLALTEGDAAQIERTNDAISRLGLTWQSFKQELATNLAGPLEGIADALGKVGKWFAGLPEPVQRFTSAIGALGIVLPPLAVAVGALAIGFGAISTPVLVAVGAFAALTAGVAALWPVLRELPEHVMALGRVIGETFTRAAEVVREFVRVVTEWIGDKLAKVWDGLGRRVQAVGDKFANLYDRVVGNSYVPDLVDGIADEFGRLGQVMEKPTEEATEKVGERFRGLVGEGLGAIRELAREGKLTFESFWQAMGDVAQKWGARIVDNAFTQLTDGLGAALSSAFSGIGGGGGSGGGGGLIGAAVSGVGNLLGLDRGGAFTVGGRAGVDRNVAAVRLSAGERVEVTPANGAGASGRAVNVNVTIQTPDPQAFQASRAQIGQQIGRAVAAGQRAA